MDQVIGLVRRYLGIDHPGLTGRRCVIVGVMRGPTPDERVTLKDDEVIGEVRADDVIEFAPLVHGEGPGLPPNVEVIEAAPGFRTERGESASWVTSDAHPWEFEPRLCQRPDVRP